MKLNQAISKRIFELMEQSEPRWTVHGLSVAAGIAYSTLNSILNGKSKRPEIESIFLVASFFGLTLKDFFDSALFDDLEYSD